MSVQLAPYRIAGGTYPLCALRPVAPCARRDPEPVVIGMAGAPEPRILVPATSPDGSQLPAGARTLVRAAQDAGWRVVARYALAEIPAWRRHLASVAKDGAHWRDVPAEMVETLCVVLRSPDGVRGFAAWRNRRWDCAWLLGPGGIERHGARSIVTRLRGVVSDAA